MFGIDFSEILVIFGIALVVLGPEKLPKLAQTIGRWVGRARGMARQFREQLEQEAEALQRTTDLRAKAPAPPPTAMADYASAAAAHGPAPDPDIASAHLASDAVPPAIAAANTPAYPDQPAPPPAESHERGP
jgi:sec-independent protein translocase protein TatB